MIDSLIKLPTEFLYSKLPYIIVILLGLSGLFAGLTINNYKPVHFKLKEKHLKIPINKLLQLIQKITGIVPFRYLRDNIRDGISFLFFQEQMLDTLSSIMTLLMLVSGTLLALLLTSIGQVWYAKIMITCISIILPYYILTLLLDLYKYTLSRQIPRMIDEFRSAFIKHGKVKPALKECSLYIDRNLGRIVSKASDSVFVENSLLTLKDRFNNVWFNIFVTLILNFKENGGEMVDQLYRLNRTMTRHNNIEKKKNKRLIWYEMFAIGSSIFSIPAVFWLNSVILETDGTPLVDARSNMIIGQVILFSILSLIIIRILRKM